MADPPYLDTATGEITDGEAWVFVQTQEVTTGTITEIDFTSGEGTEEFSQYQDMAIIGSFQFNHTGAGDDWGPLQMTFNGVYGGYPARANRSFAIRGSWQAGVTTSETNGRIALGYGVNSQATASDAFNAIYIDLWRTGGGYYKNAMGIMCGDRDGNGYVSGNSGIVAMQEGIKIISLRAAGTYFTVNSRFDLFGILPRMIQ